MGTKGGDKPDVVPLRWVQDWVHLAVVVCPLHDWFLSKGIMQGIVFQDHGGVDKADGVADEYVMGLGARRRSALGNDLLRLNRRPEELSRRIGSEKSQFHGLGAHTQRGNQVFEGKGLDVCINIAICYLQGLDRIGKSADSPIGNIDEVIIRRRGNIVVQRASGYNKQTYPAEGAVQQAVCFLHDYGPPALGALMLNLPVRSVHRS